MISFLNHFARYFHFPTLKIEIESDVRAGLLGKILWIQRFLLNNSVETILGCNITPSENRPQSSCIVFSSIRYNEEI